MASYALTGGATGIGAALKQQLLSAGHQVITVALDSADQAVAIVAAADKGTLTVVRVNEG